jgi:hypothetical protein
LVLESWDSTSSSEYEEWIYRDEGAAEEVARVYWGYSGRRGEFRGRKGRKAGKAWDVAMIGSLLEEGI